jgi:hypothetical protein
MEDWMTHQQALVLARAGQLVRARAMSKRAIELAFQRNQKQRGATYEAAQAIYETAFGNAAAAKQSAHQALALSDDRDVKFACAFALALAGDLQAAYKLEGELDKEFPEDTLVRFYYLPVLRGVLAGAHGDGAKALGFLTDTSFDLATPRTNSIGGFGALYPAFTRGRAYLAAHQPKEAAAEFQKIVEHWGLVANDPIGVRARLELGRSLAMAGDRAKAKQVYIELLNLWKDADKDIPIVNQAKAEVALF